MTTNSVSDRRSPEEFGKGLSASSLLTLKVASLPEELGPESESNNENEAELLQWSTTTYEVSNAEATVPTRNGSLLAKTPTSIGQPIIEKKEDTWQGSEATGEVCPICFHTIPNNFENSECYVTTECNHIFCKSCLQKVFDHSEHANTCTIACPMCRKDIHRKTMYIEFTPQTFVDNPDLSFITDDNIRYMVMEAYNTIHKHELWSKLRNLTPNEQEGFMFSKNPEIIRINKLVNAESQTGHSGASLAYTMRVIQQISRYGVNSLNTN